MPSKTLLTNELEKQIQSFENINPELSLDEKTIQFLFKYLVVITSF